MYYYNTNGYQATGLIPDKELGSHSIFNIFAPGSSLHSVQLYTGGGKHPCFLLELVHRVNLDIQQLGDIELSLHSLGVTG